MCAEIPDYKDTLNLPKTDFPMRAGYQNENQNGSQSGKILRFMTLFAKKRADLHLYYMMDPHMRTDICILAMHLTKF